MMSDGRMSFARAQLQRGDLHGAVRTLRQVLAEDPTLAEAHALLSLVLLKQKRLHAAGYEARESLKLDPHLPLGHYAQASVAVMQGLLKEAEEHLTTLLELEPEVPAWWRLKARIRNLQGRRLERREALLHALRLDAADVDTLVELGDEALERGDLKEAERRAHESLLLSPEHEGGLVLMGHVLLRRGRVEEAHEHAVWALRQDATDAGALGLMAAIQARRSWWLGMWWRFSVWMEMLGTTRATLVLLVAYLLSRVATYAAEDLGSEGGATVVETVWLALVVYSWVAPVLFQRLLRRELAEVRLKAGF
ncbi:tetratricopeptide repeat protein [Pyxidicoccus fallax]|nr:tetratricopeptide repeat protein [Pyxidicoccus fallax]